MVGNLKTLGWLAFGFVFVTVPVRADIILPASSTQKDNTDVPISQILPPVNVLPPRMENPLTKPGHMPPPSTNPASTHDSNAANMAPSRGRTSDGLLGGSGLGGDAIQASRSMPESSSARDIGDRTSASSERIALGRWFADDDDDRADETLYSIFFTGFILVTCFIGFCLRPGSHR
jgi:hypothetical protein